MDLRQKFLPDFLRDLQNVSKAYDAFDEFLKVAEAKKGEDFEQIPAALQAAFILTYRSVLAKYL